jgi:hypothetical protein
MIGSAASQARGIGIAKLETGECDRASVKWQLIACSNRIREEAFNHENQ